MATLKLSSDRPNRGTLHVEPRRLLQDRCSLGLHVDEIGCWQAVRPPQDPRGLASRVNESEQRPPPVRKIWVSLPSPRDLDPLPAGPSQVQLTRAAARR
jgi:hypothetical protein